MIAFKETPASIRSTMIVKNLFYDEKNKCKQFLIFTFILILNYEFSISSNIPFDISIYPAPEPIPCFE